MVKSAYKTQKKTPVINECLLSVKNKTQSS